MLIECPECKQSISDKAEVCINCGYPLNKTNDDNICSINGIEIDITEIYKYANELLEDNSNRLDLYKKSRKVLMNFTNLSPNGRNDFLNDIFDGKRLTYYNGETQEEFDRKYAKPKCPTCGSIDIQKIGAGERVVSVATLGFFSKKINKSYKCNNCKYTW